MSDKQKIKTTVVDEGLKPLDYIFLLGSYLIALFGTCAFPISIGNISGKPFLGIITLVGELVIVKHLIHDLTSLEKASADAIYIFSYGILLTIGTILMFLVP